MIAFLKQNLILAFCLKKEPEMVGYGGLRAYYKIKEKSCSYTIYDPTGVVVGAGVISEHYLSNVPAEIVVLERIKEHLGHRNRYFK